MSNTHDYTRRGFGHDIAVTKVLDEGTRIRACGFGVDIEPGDFLILRNKNDTTRYSVDEISYARDPQDQWFASMTFAPREEGVERQPASPDYNKLLQEDAEFR